MALLLVPVMSGTAGASEYIHVLQPGQRLYPGDILYSPSHAYRLIMQGDGNLVLYTGGTALWSSGTSGSGTNAVMQSDGNFVIYRSGTAIWNSNTDHHPGAFLDMQDDGNLVIYQSDRAIWSSGTKSGATTPSTGHTVGSGYRLRTGTTIYSPNHRYRLVMQGDGNLVIYQGGKARWSAGTQGHKNAQAVMQGDGNLVVYWHGNAIWSSRTAHHDGAILDMQDDGNLVIYYKGKPIWASKSAAATPAEKATVAWARGFASRHDTTYNDRCLKFVFDAYAAAGANLRPWVSGGIGENTYPVDIWGHFNHGKTGTGTPPFASLVFWKAANGNRTLSHVALSLGGGNLVSSSDGVDDYTHYEQMSQHRYAIYQGWWLPDR